MESVEIPPYEAQTLHFHVVFVDVVFECIGERGAEDVMASAHSVIAGDWPLLWWRWCRQRWCFDEPPPLRIFDGDGEDGL